MEQEHEYRANGLHVEKRKYNSREEWTQVIRCPTSQKAERLASDLNIAMKEQPREVRYRVA